MRFVDKTKGVFWRILGGNGAPKEYEPITFVNNPITIERQDLLGLSTAVNLIDDAVHQGASLVGVIADYGVGKSSLIEFISRRKKRYRNVIRINLWDSLYDAHNSGKANSTTVSSLSRSFIYQLAACVPNPRLGKKLSKYVNYRLSQNYSTISFTTFSWWRVVLAGMVCALSYFVYSISKSNSLAEISSFFAALGLTIAPNILKIGRIVTPYAAMLVGGFGAIYIVKKGNITYTPVKKENKKDVEINDLFDVYTDIIGVVTRKMTFGKKLLIVIEDLDRIIEKAVVLDFVKELYRFQNLMNEKKRKEIVFVVTILPEAKLTQSELAASPETIYSKVFDYVINLHPYHPEDYGTILLSIINSDPNSKRKLEATIGAAVDNELPDNFNWLIKGQSLTIRDLKDRLNQAIALMVTLRNKKYAVKSAVSFATCAAVTYLEHQYSKQFHALLCNEREFSALIQKALWVSNDSSQSAERKAELADAVAKCVGLGSSEAALFHDDLVEMIITRVVDNDFRMYFYSYPRESRILTNDEKDLSNLLLYPLTFVNESFLNEKVQSILMLEKTNNIIVECLERISQENKSTKSIGYPPIVLKNEYLFSQAVKIDFSMTVDLTVRTLLWKKTSLDFSVDCWRRIWAYEFSRKDEFVRRYGEELVLILSKLSEDELLVARRTLVDIMGDKVAVYSYLFTKSQSDSSYPPISKSELDAISSISVAIKLVEPSSLDENDCEYILDGITKKLDTLENFPELFLFFDAVLDVVPEEVMAPYLLRALEKTKLVRDNYTAVLSVGLQKQTIASSDEILISYINTTATDDWTESFGNMADGLLISGEYMTEVLLQLTKRGLYKSYLLTLEKRHQLETVDYCAEGVAAYILSACCKLQALGYSQVVVAVRKAIITSCNGKWLKDYNELYGYKYQLISIDELRLFAEFSTAVWCIDAALLTEANYGQIINFCNAEKRNADECAALLESIFYTEHDGWLPPDNLMGKVVYGLDFSMIDFSNMKSETQEEWIQKVDTALALSDGENAIRLMKHLNCLVASMERVMIEQGLIDSYIELINEIDMPTSHTSEWLSSIRIDFPLAPNTAQCLQTSGDSYGFIVGTTLHSRLLHLDLAQFDLELYLRIYKENADNEVFTIMSADDEFLSLVIGNQLYDSLDYAHTEPLWKFRQPLGLLKHVFTTITTTQQAIQYLKTLPHFDTNEDSQGFLTLIKENESISELLASPVARSWVKERLWSSSQKSSFTRFMNRRYPGTDEEAFLD